MTSDYFAELKKAPYPLYTAPRDFSFDLNEDMIALIRKEFSGDMVATKFAEAVKGKPASEVEKIGEQIFGDYGERWMKKVMQLGDEYSDRTIEIIKEAVDGSGNQFLAFPHVPQRFLEIAYDATQEYPKFLALRVVVNYKDELAYRLKDCFIFNTIKAKAGVEVANQMTCRHACLKALETLRQDCIVRDLGIDALITQVTSMAKNGACQFSLKRL